MNWDLEAIQTAGWVQTLDYLEELGSTNDHALLTAADNRPHPRLILCNQQQAGRGRGANRWSVSRGALTFSLVIEPESMGIPRDRWPTLSVAVGGALCTAIQPLIPEADVRLKWPNDVYANGRKLGGILVEVPAVTPPRLVIGIGVNVLNSATTAPEELRSRMVALCDLQATTAPASSRSVVLAAILNALEQHLVRLAKDPLSLAPHWRSLCFLTGRTVTLDDGVRTVTGACQGIDDDGALRIYTEFGPQRCLGGTIRSYESLEDFD